MINVVVGNGQLGTTRIDENVVALAVVNVALPELALSAAVGTPGQTKEEA